MLYTLGTSGALPGTLPDARNLDTVNDNRKTRNLEGLRGQSIIGHRGLEIVANPSIGEVSLGASLSLGSGCHLNEREDTDQASRECDRESASNVAVAGASLTGSVASSYLGVRNHDQSISVTSQRQDDAHKTGIIQPGTAMSGIGTYHLQNRLEVSATQIFFTCPQVIVYPRIPSAMYYRVCINWSILG